MVQGGETLLLPAVVTGPPADTPGPCEPASLARVAAAISAHHRRVLRLLDGFEPLDVAPSSPPDIMSLLAHLAGRLRSGDAMLEELGHQLRCQLAGNGWALPPDAGRRLSR